MWFKPKEPIVLDCDGVVLGFDPAFPSVAQAALGLDAPPVRKTNEYSLDLRYGLTRTQMFTVLEAYMDHPQGWRGLPLIDGADEVVRDLRDRGHPIHMVTGIDEPMKELRRQNLAEHGIKVDFIHCVGMGHSSKEEVVRKINPIVFVDDRLRILYESSFVPYRVFIDHGDTQDGYSMHPDIHVCNSLHQWHSEVYLPSVNIKHPRRGP